MLPYPHTPILHRRCHTLKSKFLLFIWAENHSEDIVSVATLGCETTYTSQVIWNTRIVDEICQETTKSVPPSVFVKYCWSVHIFAARILKRERSVKTGGADVEAAFSRMVDIISSAMYRDCTLYIHRAENSDILANYYSFLAQNFSQINSIKTCIFHPLHYHSSWYINI
jgi:hypothetical protein